MKRRFSAILLISILILSGCESTKEDTVASAAGFVPEVETQGSDELKKEPEILPSEQPKEEKKEPFQGQEQQTKEEEQQTKEEEQQTKEEEQQTKEEKQQTKEEEQQPAEQEQKQPEEQQPVRQEQKQPEEEQPAEEELKLNFVKFWKNVEEMSLEEANELLKKKAERPRDRMTDEERMAFYVRAKYIYFHEENGYAVNAENDRENYKNHDIRIIFLIKFEDDFTKKIYEDRKNLKLIAWEDQSFAKEFTNWSEGDSKPYGRNEMTPFLYFLGAEMQYLGNARFGYGDGEGHIQGGFKPYQNAQRCQYTDEKVKQLYLDCVRFYLSIDTIQFFDIYITGTDHLCI